MANERKRHDPDVSVPADGDYSWLGVENKQKGHAYCWVDEADMPHRKRFGFSHVIRGVDLECPSIDIGGDHGQPLRSRGLWLLRGTPAQEKAHKDWVDSQARQFDVRAVAETMTAKQGDIASSGVQTEGEHVRKVITSTMPGPALVQT